MTRTVPRALLRDVAVALAAVANPAEVVDGNPGPANLRAVVDRAPAEWRTDGFHYVTVTQVSPIAPDLEGDGVPLADAGSVQVSLWETRAGEDEDRIDAIVAALDRVAVGGRALRGRVTGTLRLPDPDTDLIQHATTVRYPLAR